MKIHLSSVYDCPYEVYVEQLQQTASIRLIT